MKLSNIQVIAISAISLLLYFGFVLDGLETTIATYPILFGVLLVFIYALVVSAAVQGLNLLEPKSWVKIIALFLILIVFDVVMFPLQVPRDIADSVPLNPNQKISFDWIVYNLLPNSIPHELKYYLTYVFAPIALLLTAGLMLGRNGGFLNALKIGL